MNLGRFGNSRMIPRLGVAVRALPTLGESSRTNASIQRGTDDVRLRGVVKVRGHQLPKLSRAAETRYVRLPCGCE